MSNRTIFNLIENDDLASIKVMLAQDPMAVHAKNKAKHDMIWSPLQFAAAAGHLDICKLLVENGAEVYTNPFNTYPPVMEASWAGHQDVVDYFLNEIPDKAEGTNGIGVMINLAGRRNWADIVKKHIEKDPLSVHSRGWIGDSPLHWPAHNNNVEIVTMLLDAGADIEADELNCYGGKPLHWASEHAPDTVKLLLDRGAEVNSRNMKESSEFFGMTPLIMNATQKDDCSAVTDHLLNAGADKSAVDSKGKTAFDHATERNLTKIITVLTK